MSKSNIKYGSECLRNTMIVRFVLYKFKILFYCYCFIVHFLFILCSSARINSVFLQFFTRETPFTRYYYFFLFIIAILMNFPFYFVRCRVCSGDFHFFLLLFLHVLLSYETHHNSSIPNMKSAMYKLNNWRTGQLL